MSRGPLTVLALVVGALGVGVTAPAPTAAAEVEVRLTTSTPRFYPPDDDYRDVARFRVRLDRRADVTFQVRRSRTAAPVRLLDLGSLPAGRHAATWDGRDDGGATAAPGRYLVRALARRPGRPVQRSPYVVVRLGWKVLAEQSSTTHLTANSYHRVSGECGRLVQLAGHRVRFAMDEPEECPKGFSGMLEAHYRFAQYPAGFADRDVVIDPHVTVRANGNHPVGFGVLGVETWLELDSEEESGWEWFYDPSSGSDGVVEISTPLGFHQPTERPVSFSFGGSTGDDYVLDGFVVEMTWRTLVPAA